MSNTQKQPTALPDDVLWEWFKASLKKRDLHDFDFFVLRDVADKAAAYGREQAQWVPVSERLPKDGKTVIFWIAPAEYASVGNLDVDSRCFHSVGGWVNQDDVSHWMPLPEPPTC